MAELRIFHGDILCIRMNSCTSSLVFPMIIPDHLQCFIGREDFPTGAGFLPLVHSSSLKSWQNTKVRPIWRDWWGLWRPALAWGAPGAAWPRELESWRLRGTDHLLVHNHYGPIDDLFPPIMYIYNPYIAYMYIYNTLYTHTHFSFIHSLHGLYEYWLMWNIQL